jgi:hypothetical protein
MEINESSANRAPVAMVHMFVTSLVNHSHSFYPPNLKTSPRVPPQKPTHASYPDNTLIGPAELANMCVFHSSHINYHINNQSDESECHCTCLKAFWHRFLAGNLKINNKMKNIPSEKRQ